MEPIEVKRPRFPEGYVDHPTSMLTWADIEKRLQESLHYWFCSVKQNNHPHVVPRWGVWVDGQLYYDGSPETVHAKNITFNPYVAVHLESGDKAVILNGESKSVELVVPELGHKLSEEFCSKYKSRGYAPEPSQWDQGGLFTFVPRDAICWTNFMDNPTKFVFHK